MHPANYDQFGWGRERQAQLLAEAKRDRLAQLVSDPHPHRALAWLTGAGKRAGENEREIWQTMFHRLVEQIARNGFQVKRKSELGRWVSEQRGEYSVGTLNKRRSRLLEALPGWTWGASAPGGRS